VDSDNFLKIAILPADVSADRSILIETNSFK